MSLSSSAPALQPLIYGPQQRPAALRAAAARSRYVAKLFVNGHYVDTSQDIGLSDDFTAQFKDIFRWALLAATSCALGRLRDP